MTTSAHGCSRICLFPLSRLPAVLAACFLFSAVADPAGATLIQFDFETGGQWGSNFRQISSDTGQALQSSNGGANDLVMFDSLASVNNFSITYVYDTTPADSTAGTQSSFNLTNGDFTVSVDLASASAASSFGIYFADAANNNNNLLALFNIDISGSTDRFRFYRDGAMNTSQAAVGTQVGADVNGSSGLNAGAAADTLTVTLSIANPSAPTISASVGSLSASQAYAPAQVDWTHTTVILRFFDASAVANGGLSIDNLVLSQPVPEPSVAILLFLGMAGLCARYRHAA